MNKNSSWETSVKPVVVLSVIALIVSLLLAMVNSFTAPIIEDNQKAATLAAYVDVMPTVSSASDLEEVTDYTTENITGAVKATDGSLAIKAEEKGFDGGILSVIIGFDTNGTVTGIWVDASTQTKGIGYTLTVVLMASIREILGSGTWLGFQVLPESMAKMSIMTQAPGAFFCYGVLMAGCIWLEGKLDARIERKSCCDLDNLKKEAE